MTVEYNEKLCNERHDNITELLGLIRTDIQEIKLKLDNTYITRREAGIGLSTAITISGLFTGFIGYFFGKG